MPITPSQASRRLEFRIPISPREGFFAQVRLFHFALQQLGGDYAAARVRVVVGDRCDLDQVRRSNGWSENANIVWESVPNGLADVAGMWGTANWRLSLPPDGADVVILSDADTVLLRDIDPILDDLASTGAVVRGHMAHYPPPVGREEPAPADACFWPAILDDFGARWTQPWERYSMDVHRSLPVTPPYFNLGFVAMNPAALAQLGTDIHWTSAWVQQRWGSHMRCQIALSLAAMRRDMDIGCLPAPYNAANDIHHFAINDMAPEDIRVLHYLRENEFQRDRFLLPGHVDEFLAREMELPANRLLQDLVRRWRDTLPPPY